MRKLFLSLFLVATNVLQAHELPLADHLFGVSALHEDLDQLSEGLKMPPILKHGQVPVLNQGGGYAIVLLDSISRKCIDYGKTIEAPILDIGAGYGTISKALLKETSCTVIAEDIGRDNLLVLRKQTSVEDLNRLFLNNNRFPNELCLPHESLGAVAISQVLHFLEGDEIDEGLGKIYDWLVPGGKIFIVTCSPYVQSLKEWIPIYEERLAQGIHWPGLVQDFPSLCPEMKQNLPPFLHVIDQKAMTAALVRAGFLIEEMTWIDRRHTIPSLGLDGRESIGVIAVKP